MLLNDSKTYSPHSAERVAGVPILTHVLSPIEGVKSNWKGVPFFWRWVPLSVEEWVWHWLIAEVGMSIDNDVENGLNQTVEGSPFCMLNDGAPTIELSSHSNPAAFPNKIP